MIVQAAATAEGISKVLQALKDVYGLADGDRGVTIAVVNRTSKELDLTSHLFESGGWAEPPDDRIPAGKTCIYSVRDTGFMQGTEGSVTYTAVGGDPNERLRISWNNPYLGSNSGSAVTVDLRGWLKQSDVYNATYQIGSGNISSNKYEFWEK